MSDNSFYEILKYLIPQIGILALVYLFLENWLKRDRVNGILRKQETIQNLLLPNQVHALERMVLFLERISPNNLIPRLNQQGLNANEFQYLLTKEIADEYDHNLSQQLYIPTATWQYITLTKDQIIQEIIHSAQSLAKDAPSKDLAYKVMENIAQNPKISTDKAIQMIKKDLTALSH